MIEVIDDFIDNEYQERIKNTLFSNAFPWYYIVDVTSAEKTEEERRAPACRHMFAQDEQITSSFYDMLVPMVNKVCQGTEYNTVTQCRSFLQFPLSETYSKPKIDHLHIDMHVKHLVLLYYVCDSDGDTIIVDRPHDVPPTQMDKCPVLARVTPKQGRAVIFDGSLYHTAHQPRSNMRCIINFNLIEKINKDH